jgi:hypothetical protein
VDKFCKRCAAVTRRYYDGRCRLCRQRESRLRRERHPERVKAAKQAWLAKRPDLVKAQIKAWAKKNPESMRANARKYHTGWTQVMFDAAWVKQKGRCAICRIVMRRIGHLKDSVSADHCHNSDQPRGLLCNRCNTGIGYFEDEPYFLRTAASYLVTHSAKVRMKNIVQNGMVFRRG